LPPTPTSGWSTVTPTAMRRTECPRSLSRAATIWSRSRAATALTSATVCQPRHPPKLTSSARASTYSQFASTANWPELSNTSLGQVLGDAATTCASCGESSGWRGVVNRIERLRPRQPFLARRPLELQAVPVAEDAPDCVDIGVGHLADKLRVHGWATSSTVRCWNYQQTAPSPRRGSPSSVDGVPVLKHSGTPIATWPAAGCGPYAGRVSDNSVVVLGGSGLVGSRVLELWSEDMLANLLAPTHADLDVLDGEALKTFLRQTDAPVVLNLAAWADVDAAEPERGDLHGPVYGLNVVHPGRLASVCGELGKYLVHVSTDYVFDGTSTERPYREGDATNPLGWYAQTKELGERRVLDSGTRACVVRIEMPFTARAHPRSDFARICLTRLGAGELIMGVEDQRITPVFLDDVVHALRLIACERFAGIVHVAATDWTTPYGFARSIAQRLGLNTGLVHPQQFEIFAAGRAAPRPQHSWLDVSLFAESFGRHVLRPGDAQLDAWINQLATTPSRA
jgi:dTDP-4-dehydrorhamnose reductase